MANAIPSRLGQKDSAGDAKALFLKVFAGEVLAAFAETNVFLSRTRVRSIESGKSAQFPATWKGTASYHTPGVELLGTTVNANERIITIDDLLVADRFIALIDEAMNHYDVRAEYSRDVGAALARQLDKNLAQLGYLTAEASATVSGGDGGTVITDASLATADNAVTAAFTAARRFDEKNVPESDRFMFVKPLMYYTLINSGTKTINVDFNRDGSGSVQSGQIFRLYGMEIVKTNNLPTSNITTGPSAYQGDFTNMLILFMHRSAVGTVKLVDLSVEMEYDIRRQGTLIVAKYALGHGILRPEAAVEAKTS